MPASARKYKSERISAMQNIRAPPYSAFMFDAAAAALYAASPPAVYARFADVLRRAYLPICWRFLFISRLFYARVVSRSRAAAMMSHPPRHHQITTRTETFTARMPMRALRVCCCLRREYALLVAAAPRARSAVLYFERRLIIFRRHAMMITTFDYDAFPLSLHYALPTIDGLMLMLPPLLMPLCFFIAYASFLCHRFCHTIRFSYADMPYFR